MLRHQFYQHIQLLVAEDKLGLALTAMLDIVQDSEARKELILFSNQHSHLRREERHMQQVAESRARLNMNFLDFLESTIPTLPEPIDDGPLRQLTQQQGSYELSLAAPQSGGGSYSVQESAQAKPVIGSAGFVAGKTPLSRLPFKQDWAKPSERDSLDRWAQALGREQEVEEVAATLKPGSHIAIHGLGGTGKSTLASMIAQQLGGTFPGGVLWAELGHEFKGQQAIQPLLNHWATYYMGGPAMAYKNPDWADWLFEASAVREILGGHGAILVILDDLWDTQVWEAIRPSIPAEAAVLVTTRDARIARSVGNNYELSGMRKSDAIALLRQFTPEIPEEKLLNLGTALGFHVQALQIAGSDLRSRPEHQRLEAINQLIRQVEAGTSLGDLHEVDGVPHQAAVATSLKLSYDDIGERMGADYQQAIRFLGIMGTEESILIPELAQALWNLSEKETRLFLEVLTARSLLQTSETPGIYRQHALVRGFSRTLLKKQNEEALAWERYREFLLNWLESASDLETEDYTAIEMLRPHIFRLGDTLVQNLQEEHPGAADAMIRFTGSIWVYLLRRPALGARGEAWLHAGLSAAKKLGRKDAEAVFLNALGNWELGRGSTEGAKSYYEQAMVLAEEGNSPISLSLLQQNLGVMYMNEAKPQKAKALFEQALPQLREDGDVYNEAMALQNLGTVLLSLGDFEKSIEHLKEAIPQLQELKHRYGEGLALANLGRAYISTGNIPEAYIWLDKALPVLQEVGNIHGESVALQNRGNLRLTQGHIKEAEEDLLACLDGFISIGHTPEIRSTRILLANMYMRNGAYALAQPFLNALTQDRDQDPDGFDKAIAANPGTLSAMASIYALSGNTEKAVDMFEVAGEMFISWGNESSFAEMKFQQGDAYIRVGKPVEAEPFLREAEALYSRLNNPIGLAMTHNELGMAMLYQGRHQEAYDYLKKAYPVFQNSSGNTNDGTIVLIQNNMALALAGLERTKEALEAFDFAREHAKALNNPGLSALVIGNQGMILFQSGAQESGIQNLKTSIALLQNNNLSADAGGQSLKMHQQILAQMEAAL